MIIYHVMSGIPPGDARISIDTDLEVAKGHRPSLEFQDYTILPNFKNLEVLMTTCWNENPAGRDFCFEVAYFDEEARILRSL